MRTWPALDVGWLQRAAATADVGAGLSEVHRLQVALLDYTVTAVDERAADSWRVFFDTSTDRDAAARELSHQFPALTFQALDEPDEDWATRSQAALRAVHVGRVLVAPPWDIPDAIRPRPNTTAVGESPPLRDELLGAAPLSSGTIVVVIRPSMGFGTGHHATTRLCLAALQSLDLHGRRALDVGTGSGVLAIAAARLGAADVLAIDDDPDALLAARDNLSLNPGVMVTLSPADVRSSGLEPRDLVVANLTGGLLIQVAGRLHDLTTASARLILSGFQTHEEADVRRVYPAFAVSARTQEDEWLCVTLQRTP